VPRFYPNVVTLTHGAEAIEEQRQAIRLLEKSNLPGRWAVKDSFNELDLGRLGFDVLFEANWIRAFLPDATGPSSDIVWERGGKGPFPVDDENFTMFTGRRGFQVVAGGTIYRAEGMVGISNVVADAADAVAVWRQLALLAVRTFPRLPLVGYESGAELQAAVDAGFELGDPLKIWVRSKD
jgi:hypothetical protein